MVDVLDPCPSVCPYQLPPFNLFLISYSDSSFFMEKKQQKYINVKPVFLCPTLIFIYSSFFLFKWRAPFISSNTLHHKINTCLQLDVQIFLQGAELFFTFIIQFPLHCLLNKCILILWGQPKCHLLREIIWDFLPVPSSEELINFSLGILQCVFHYVLLMF